MSEPRNFSRATKREAYARANGRCENPSCGIALPAGWGGIHYDHRIAWALSRDSSIGNCQCLCDAGHLEKSAGSDIPIIAKVQRIRDRAIGIKRSSKKFPGGRDSAIRKKLNGEVVARKSQSQQHREMKARREIGGSFD